MLQLSIPLVGRSERDIIQAITKRVKAIKNVKECRQVNIHLTGKRSYVEMQLLLDSNTNLEDARKISLEIEREVEKILPDARVTIHTRPEGYEKENIWKFVKEAADSVPGSRGAHNIHIQKIGGKMYIDLHLEVSAEITVKQAHEVSEQVEKRIKSADPDVSEITVHMESASDLISRELMGVETELESFIEDAAKRFPEIKQVHDIKVRRIGNSLHVVLNCHFDPDTTMKKAHEISSRLENAIKDTYPDVKRIDIHEEPE